MIGDCIRRRLPLAPAGGGTNDGERQFIRRSGSDGASLSAQFVGTKPVEQRLQFDVAALERFLKSRIDGLAGPLHVEQFKGGQSNPTYRLAAADGRRFVLRRKPPGKLLPSAHAVEREYAVMAALHGTGFPVPKTHVLCEDESVIGTAFFVMDYVEGRVMWDQSLPGMTRAERGAIWSEMNRVIALLHATDYVGAWPRVSSGGPATTSSGRLRAGRSSTRHRRPRRSRRWTI